MKKLALVLVAALPLAAVGCKKGGGDCAAAVAHSMELSKDMMKTMGNDDATLAKLKDIGVQHCKDDKWSDDAIKCMLDAKAMADGKACYGKLSADQQKSMNDAAQAAMKPATPPTPAPAAGSATAGSGSAPAH